LDGWDSVARPITDREGRERGDTAGRCPERGGAEAHRRSTSSRAAGPGPRLGHLHYYVDGQSWPIVDTSGETVVLVGLTPGPHTVRLELADATHKPIAGASQLVEFSIPQK